jgi:hypothetical protein
VDIEKEVLRFNRCFAVVLAVAAVFDIALVWGFVRVFMFLRSL